MKTKHILLYGAIGLLMAACSKETPFQQEETPSGMGSFSKTALMLDVKDGVTIQEKVHSRAGELDDFKILFFKNGSVAPEATYRYAEMPDVVVLPVGKYTVTATKGEDVEAEWESPYFLGESSEFEIGQDEVTSDIDPIVCRLQNVKVTVEFAPVLTANMSEDSHVEVRVGQNTSLKFTKDDELRAGHFRHTEGVSLVATFNGIVQDQPLVETKSFSEVQKGHHYKLKFKLDPREDDHYGEVDAGVSVDASVTVTDIEYNIVVNDDEPMDDGERPKEGGDDPVPPTPGDEKAPTIVGVAPIDLDKTNEITDGMSCVLNIESTAPGGFTVFICDIESDQLNSAELASVGLSDHLDLVNPEEALVAPLNGLGFPVYVGGRSKVEFNLTKFMPMLGALGEGVHNFVLTVGDANGTTVKTLILEKK